MTRPDPIVRLRPVTVLLLVLAWAQPAAALQRRVVVEPGARVRVQARSLGGPLIGTVRAAEPDTLVVRVDGEGAGLIVPVDSIIWLAVRRERAQTLEGAGAGALAGSLLAVTAHPGWAEDDEDCEGWGAAPCIAYEISPRLGTRLAVLIPLGVVVGAIAGSQSRTATWRSVRLERVGLAPVSGGRVGVGVTLSF
jgi:hypothetical protein